jgi:hypothetical protein
VGKQTFTAVLTREEETLLGTVTNSTGTHTVTEGTVKGDQVSWVLRNAAMGMDLAFTGTVVGDDVTGHVKAGAFGRFPVTGTRL